MNTSFWGKDGWKLVHSIAYAYDETQQKCYKTFYNSIQHILPCIYCRRSYKDYITTYPIQTDSKRDLTRWIYTIHNCVNEKLRKQGYLTTTNPYLKDVDEIYKRQPNCLVGIDFIYCVLFNYNLEISETRKKAYLRFFHCLQYILPNEKIRAIYQDYFRKYPLDECLAIVHCEQTLEPIKQWVYRLDKTVHKKCCSYKSRCKKIEKHRVENCLGQTCRKK